MEKLIGWWVRNPVAANLLMVGVLLSGYLGFTAMEREAFPSVKPNQVLITVIWPGAAPQEVEEQIVLRIEQALKNLDNVHRVISTATEGQAEIRVTTYPKVAVESFLNDVKNVVDSVSALPRDIENPRVQRFTYRDEMNRVVLSGDVGQRELQRLAEDLRDELAALPYVAVVELFGARREEVTIELSEDAMRRFGLSFSQVADAIRGSSINLSSGRVRTATGDVLLRARNLADSERDFGDIVVRQSADGAVVRVADVANVVDGFEEEEILATVNGQPAVLLQLLSTDNMQVVKASEAVTEWLEQAQANLPTGVTLSPWFDTAEIYNNRMQLIGESAALGLLLVLAVLMLSLRPRVAFWVSMGIGVAFLGTFAMLPANDVSLNIISTFAFLLVLGIVVDDAIVVGESIHEHAHRLGGGERAAIEGAAAVARPVIFAVLTTMIAFAPWFFVTGEEAQITRQLSIVITAALAISLVEAFLILPSHLRNLQHRENLTGIAARQKRVEHSIVKFANTHYRRLLMWGLQRRYLTCSLFIAAFVISIGLFSTGWVRFYFQPQVESEQVYINVKLPPGAPYSRALEILEQLQEAERQLVEQVQTEAEQRGGTGELVEGWYTRSRRDSVIAIIKLAPPETRDLSARETAEQLRLLVGDIPDAEEIEVVYTLNDNGADVTYLLRHRDIDTLRRASTELQQHIRSYNGVFAVTDSLQGESDELLMQLRPGAEKLGVSLASVSQQLRQAYFGEEVQRLPRETGDVKVMVKYPRELRNNLNSLGDFRIRTPDGREIALLSVVDVELSTGVQRIERRDGERVVYVRSDMDQDLMTEITTSITDSYLPQLQQRYPKLVILKGGQQEAEEEFFSEIQALYTIALFAMYALIAIAFRSYWLPLLVMTAIPFGFMGAVYGHLLFNTPMALFSWFGIGAAAGVVVNDNLVLVDYIGRLRDRGLSISEAIIEAGCNRFRPILLTTVTTFVGLIPIMMERSTDAQFLKPAVLSLAFGVLFALMVSLLMVPALYLVGDDIRLVPSRLLAKFRQRSGGGDARARPAAPTRD